MTCFLDLFSGIGGFALAAYWAGLRFDKHYFSEIDNYAVRVYQKHFPEAELIGNIKNVSYSSLAKGEYAVCGGFPCQPHSAAGKKKGAEDDRDLWPECARMLRELRPEIAVFENVPGLFVSNGGDFFNRVLSDISESGYDAEWRIISAAELGAPHVRKRVWIAAYPQGKRWRTVQKNKNTSYKKGSGEEYAKWNEFQFAAAGAYSIELRKGDESFVCGMDDGLPDWLDRLKCAGNAIVPQCAGRIFRLPAFDRWRIKQV
jgi:DNA (cytosine-5)-methyltransferase 1